MKREEEKKPTRLDNLRQFGNDIGSFMHKRNEDGVSVVMGRTGTSWGKISLFFFVYYACLTGFCAAMFAIAFSTMPEKKDGPKYTSFIADKPALLVYPKGGLNSYSKDTLGGFVDDYNSFLKDYAEQYTPCYDSYNCVVGASYRPEEKTKQCTFDTDQLGPCAPSKNATFGFEEKLPCLYLRLTKIYNWKPEQASDNHTFVHMECKAGDPAVKIKYYPSKNKFFPISHWPFRGESHFMTPIGAIQVDTNYTTTIQCKAIADNIELSKTWKLKRGATGKLEFDVSPAIN